MTTSTTFRFDGLQLPPGVAYGRATIELDHNGEWEIYDVNLIWMEDADGERCDVFVPTADVKAALIAQRSAAIQDKVNETLEWECVS